MPSSSEFAQTIHLVYFALSAAEVDVLDDKVPPYYYFCNFKYYKNYEI
jgi:hypothetical protein